MMTDERRPRARFRIPAALPLVSAFAAGILSDRYVSMFDTRLWAIVALGGIALGVSRLIAKGKLGRVGEISILIAWVGLGGARHHAIRFDVEPDDVSFLAKASGEPRPSWFRGVTEGPAVFRPAGRGRAYETGGTRFTLVARESYDGRAWSRVSGKTSVYVQGDRTDLAPGSSIEVVGRLHALTGPLNPGETDFREYRIDEGVRSRLDVESPQAIWSVSKLPRSEVAAALGLVQEAARRRLLDAMPPETYPLAAALLLGRREAVDPEVNDAFSRTGTMHLLAISGLHLQALAGALWFAIHAAGVGRRKSAYILISISTLYSLLVGLSPSVVRSLAMTVAACLAGLWDRRGTPSGVLSLAGLITLLLNPTDLFDIGCRLSFLAVAVILWIVPSVERRCRRRLHPLDLLERRLQPKWKRSIRRCFRGCFVGVLTSAVVWAAALPITLLSFHVNSPIAILLNIPLIPMTSLALLLGGAAMIVSIVSLQLAAPLTWGCAVLLQWTEVVVLWGVRQPWGHWFEPSPTVSWTILFYLILLAATVLDRTSPSRRIRISVNVLLAVWSLLGFWRLRPPGRLEADVIATGHGLSVAIVTPSGKVVLYDAGRLGDPSVGKRIIAPCLWSRGVSRIETVVLSHADADHYNGMLDLIDCFEIGEIRVPPGFFGGSNPGTRALRRRIEERRIPVSALSDGTSWEPEAGVRIKTLHPPAESGVEGSDNSRSAVLSVESRGGRFLLTGDLEGQGLLELLSKTPPESGFEAVLSPHHGSRAANPPELYDWAKAGFVVVSQARPRATTRDPFEALPIPVLRTWERGAIRLSWTDSGIMARGFLDP